MNASLLRTLTIVTIFFMSAAFPSVARDLTDGDRDRYINEIRNYKHKFLAEELKLTKEQQREFFVLYDQMEDRIQQLNSETRELERATAEKADASDIELQSAAQAVFELKQREGEIEMEYFSKFREILQPRQLLKLKSSERKFTQSLMRYQRKLKQDNHKKKVSRHIRKTRSDRDSRVAKRR